MPIERDGNRGNFSLTRSVNRRLDDLLVAPVDAVKGADANHRTWPLKGEPSPIEVRQH
jgi:hypothetical protein